MPNLFKRALKALACVLLIVSGMGFAAFQFLLNPGPNLLTSNSKGGEVKMLFGATSANPKDRYGALLVPIRFAGIDRDFYLQVDTGHPNTKFHRAKIESIWAKQTSTDPSRFDPKNGIAFQMGGADWLLKPVTMRNDDSASINWDNPNQVQVVGTLGSDAWDKRMVEFDYPQEVIRWGDSVNTSDLKDTLWKPIQYRMRRTLLPTKLDGKELWLMFDSGSSAYQLITDQSTYDRLKTTGGKVEETKGKSWGKTIDIKTCEANSSIEIGGKSLPLTKVTQMSGMGPMAESLMSLTGLQGMTGNTLFLKEVLVIDYESERFQLRMETKAVDPTRDP